MLEQLTLLPQDTEEQNHAHPSRHGQQADPVADHQAQTDDNQYHTAVEWRERCSVAQSVIGPSFVPARWGDGVQARAHNARVSAGESLQSVGPEKTGRPR
jgi:hypothetical protein